RLVLYLLVGTITWRFLGLIFEQMAETIAWERWEGTIEYTFMAPVPRVTHLLGMCGATLVRALGFSVAILAAVAVFVPVDLSHANALAAIVLLVVGAVAFVGLAIASAVFPLLWTEKGLQMAYIVQAVVLLVSGVYYPTTILPGWMQILSFISPATYVIRGMRDALLDGADLAAGWPHPDENWAINRFIVSRGGRRVGHASSEHARWEVQPERYGTVGGELLPMERTQTTLGALFEAMEKRVVADGARVLGVYAYENDPLRIAAIEARGYKEDRRSRRWELDLVANREKLLAMAEISRERMRREGVRILTLAQDADP